MSHLRRIGSVAGLYTLSNGLNAAVPVLLLPFLTRSLSREAFGVVGMYELLLALMLPFVGVNLQGAIARQYYERDTVDFPRFIGTSLILLVISSVCVALVMFVAAGVIGRVAAFPPQWLPSVLLGAFGQFLTLVALSVWQVRELPVRYGVFRVVQTLANIGLSLLLVLGLGWGYEGRLIAQAGTSMLFGLLAIGWLWREGYVRLDWVRRYAETALRFGVPLVPHILGFWMINMVDRLIVGAVLGPSEVGRYTAVYQIGMGIGLVQNSFNQAWTPWFFERLKGDLPEDKLLIVRITYGYFGLMLLSAVLLGVASPLLGRVLLGPEFRSASTLIGWIGLGYAFQGMYKMVTNYLFYSGDTGHLAAVSLGTGMVGAGLSYTGIRFYGLWGAALASSTTFLISFLATWWIAERAHPMPWRDGLRFARAGS